MVGNGGKEAQGRRLKLARERVAPDSATDGWAEVRRRTRSSISKDAYIQHENGTRSLKGQAVFYAAAFDVPEEWLVWGKNPPDWADNQGNGQRSHVRAVPIISDVAAGLLAEPGAQIEGEHQTIEISGLPPGEYFATRVDGDSMDRLSPEGSLILVNRAEREPLPGRRYIFGRKGETTYKRFERDPVRLMPESTNPRNEPIFPRSDEEWTVIGRVRLTLLDDL